MSTKEPIPIETITQGYAATTRDLDAARKAKLAREFQPSPRMEQLLVLRDRDPAAYTRMGASVQISVGHYELGRTAAGYTPEGDEDGNTAA